MEKKGCYPIIVLSSTNTPRPDELPDVAQDYAADEVRHEKARAVEITQLEVAGHDERKDETHHVDQDDVDDRVGHGDQERIQEIGNREQVGEILKADEIDGIVDAVPVGHRIVEAEKERHQDDHRKGDHARRDEDHINDSVSFQCSAPEDGTA